MRGIHDHEYLALRFEAFAKDVLQPMATRRLAALEIGIQQPTSQWHVAAASVASYETVAPGHRWGPRWSTAWFRLSGECPSTAQPNQVAVSFCTGTEALVWYRGNIVQGLAEHRTLCPIADLELGRPLEVFVEAACNQPLGVTTFWWDAEETVRRWKEQRPGRVSEAWLVEVNPALWRMGQEFDFARQIALALPPESATSYQLLRDLREWVRQCEEGSIESRQAELQASLGELLQRGHDPATQRCWAIGHAHIDTAWLWPVREARRKLLRSWSNVLRVMDRFDKFQFMASQAQHYAFVEEDNPALFAQIQDRVREGRWEAIGGMWVEPDCQCPSGESLVRQLLLGQQYFAEKFGQDAQQSVAYLPDSFGFPASLPQILRKAGLTSFVTNKISWNERNEFPHATFLWRGIDGTEILSHFTPGDNYNAELTAKEVLHGANNLLRKDRREVGQRRAQSDEWLQPFGFGDGGGGPTPEMACRLDMSLNIPGFPRLHSGRADVFCANLEATRQEERRKFQRDLPVWDDELYLELHRGTFTSQAWIKQANTDLERRFKRVELLTVLSGVGDPATRRQLRSAWQDALLLQFHDILPGTSIPEVFADARRDYQNIGHILDAVEHACRDRWTGACVINTTSHTRSEWIHHAGRWVWVDSVPPMSVTALQVKESPGDRVTVTKRSLENQSLRVELDEAGRICGLHRLSGMQHWNAVGDDPLQQLVVYSDRPRRWDAWDIDFDYTDSAEELSDSAERIEVVEDAGVVGAIEVHRQYRSSRIVQTYRLFANSNCVEIEWQVDWHEQDRLLRVLNPVNLRTRYATFGIQFGVIQRPTTRNTSWQEAQFEVPGHRFMDLSQSGCGLAILDNGKYGRSAEGSVLGLSLLRGSKFPDPQAEQGLHRFKTALLPHGGSWQTAGVAQAADELAEPLVVFQGAVSKPDSSIQDSPVSVQVLAGGAPEIAAVKWAEDGNSVILRLVERWGGVSRIRIDHHSQFSSVTLVDLMERPWQPGSSWADQSFELSLQPFEIVTLSCQRKN